MTKCIELLPCDWLIRNLCYQAFEQVYLIKWLVSVYIYIYVGLYCDISLYLVFLFEEIKKWFSVKIYTLYISSQKTRILALLIYLCPIVAFCRLELNDKIVDILSCYK